MGEMRRKLLALGAVLAAVCPMAAAQDHGWPKEIATQRGTVLIYQPQIDSFRGTILEGRCAVSFTATGGNEPIFGAFWFKALLETDFDTRTARLISIQVPRVKFAGATEEKQREVGAFLEQEIPKLALPISIDRLAAAMEETAKESRGAGAFKSDPPKIVFSYEPAVLLLYEGAPILRDIEGQEGVYRRAVNTPLPVVLDVKAKKLYLCGGEVWYAAADPLGPWSVTTDVPAPLLAMKKQADARPREEGQAAPAQEARAQAGAQPRGEERAAAARPPKVIVATEPTELLVIFGAANWSTIAGTDLLYVSNSQADIFKEITTQRTYVLLSGRWFSSPSLDGPWVFVPPGELPRDFARIPEGSPVANVLASVPGTAAAKDALLDAQIPQTAAIKREGAALEVTYDGAPQFKAIEGTKLEFAVNTASSVIKLDARYYCCHQAVWYVAATPQGPWQVADHVPEEIYTIPPSNPHYNTTYVHVYDATPSVVYTGYYPGYVNSYVYGGCVVYGTGWYYPPYISPYFYHPWYPTWGMGVGWNPWTGWAVGVTWVSGPFTVTVGFAGWAPYPWYGPYGYHPPYYPYPPRPGVPPVYRPPGGPPTGSGPGGAHAAPYGTNVYAKRQNLGRNAGVPRDKGAQAADRVARSGANDVFTDRNGDVYRRNADGSWQQRDKGGWAKPEAGTRPGDGATTRPAGLERDFQARERGTARTNSYRGSGGGSARGARSGGRVH